MDNAWGRNVWRREANADVIELRGKQVIDGYDRPECGCMGVPLEPVGRDERRMQDASRAYEDLEIVVLG